MEKALEKIIFTGLKNLIGEMDETEFLQYKKQLSIIELNRGETLFNQNDEADSIYILLSGKLEVLINDGDNIEKRIGFVYRTETVGEMAMLTEGLRSATVRSFRNSILAKMSNLNFMELCYSKPNFAINVSRFIVKRLENTIQAKKSRLKYSNISIFDAGNNAKTSGCIDALIRLYKDKNNFLTIGKKEIIEIIGENENDKRINLLKIAHFINEQEIKNINIIFDLRLIDSEIIIQLLDYSDSLLLFYDASKEFNFSDLNNINQFCEHAIGKIKHIICHRSDLFLPSNTISFLANLKKGEHTHIRENNHSDILRIFKNINGKSIGLVLGGGGAKGIAHLGVLKALSEAKIHIDYIAGTSIGAIYAGAYAMYQDYKAVYEISQKTIAENPTDAFNFNLLPRFSLYSDRKINRQLSSVFKDCDFEDLWLPFFCISSNITVPEMTVHETGNLKNAIRASMSVPGLLKPIIINNNLHVDGGVFNNIPIDVMLEKNSGHIIASRVDVEEKNKQVKLPGLISTIVKSAIANSDRNSNKLEAFVDLLFQPNVAHFGLLKWNAHEKIFDLGYQHALKTLAQHADVVDKLKSNI